MNQKFLDRASEVYEEIKRMNKPTVVHHYDCDGLTSGAIVIKGLQDMNKPYKQLMLKKIDEKTFEGLRNEKEIIFVDLGASTDIVDELNYAVIIDHHQVKCNKHLQLNPHLFGIDGNNELSASGTAYHIMKNSPGLAIVGAIGDMQYPLIGANREILEDGINQSKIKKITDLKLYGKSGRPLAQMLSYANDPFLPGLTGNDERCSAFLENTGIKLKQNDKGRSYFDLDQTEKKILLSQLVSYLAKRGMKNIGNRLIGEVYLLNDRPINTEFYDASEFSTVLNACGRNMRGDIALNVCLNNSEAYKDASEMLRLHRKNLREGLIYTQKNIVDLGKFLFIDGRGIIDESIIGVIAGMIFTTKRDKPILSVSNGENDTLKVSGRATREHVENGVNLGKLMDEVSKELGGMGGGHTVAAGCSLPRGTINEFLIEANKRL